jgi:hypothetical protein
MELSVLDITNCDDIPFKASEIRYPTRIYGARNCYVVERIPKRNSHKKKSYRKVTLFRLGTPRSKYFNRRKR